PIIGAFSCRRIKNHAIHGIGDEKLWYNRAFRKFADLINGFPVRKNTKDTDIVQYAIKRVEKGSSIFWFPEGQRHKNPADNKCYPGKLGSGMIAHALSVPIIPAFIYGTEFAMPVGKKLTLGRGPRSIKILVKYGPPVPLDDLRELPSSKETSQRVVNLIMDHIEELRPKGRYRMQK
ncbi:MAG: lysophospholipid acyltransferase family protein, partial [Candidatus Kariarchaeaceae archaeon]